jgi:hypothetical protein
LCGKKTIQSKPVKDKSGKVLTSIEDQLKRWREHFKEVLNRPPPVTQTTLQEATPLDIETGPVTKTEVKIALKTLKNGKSAGFDNIPAEAWKVGDWISEEVLHYLLNKIWNDDRISPRIGRWDSW